ncbi:FAD/NAD(P)-binding domain-containing protein [Aureobasidium sp. EXF-3400]|nr:FAD/NAD(P)-binding domain-containing protein [Aureobasidium sp. EXF-12344]KAI4775384.1 FAD/NAD(P)-binding domain-containing protein [Aureobasidium sp. EXF-3400]
MLHPSKLQNVVVVGGSLGGLMHALAIMIHCPKVKVTILERSPTALLHNQGAGVVAGADTQSFFSRYVYLRWRVDDMDIKDYISGSDLEKLQAKLSNSSHGTASYQYGCNVKSVEDLGPSEGVRVRWTNKSDKEEEITADLVIAADGASSSVRRTLLPSVQRTYAGYVALRGTVPETEVSESAAEAFVEKFAFYHADGTQILAYAIPGENGTLEPGKRLMNWVWYRNYKEDSDELVDLMTGKDGSHHHITLPPDQMKDEVWTKQKQEARDVLPPQFAELVDKTVHPFVQAITDNISPNNEFFDGKLLLVGDSLAGFRPHTAASTSQAAFDASTLGEWLEGEIDKNEYNHRVMDYAVQNQRHGVELGERSQFGKHPLAC